MTPYLPSLGGLLPNPDWGKLPLFDRTGWRTLPFGEFAQSINERVEPSEAAEDIYVGLEHLDPQSLHIRCWGKGSDVIGTKLRFRKGNIIFGRRRAYQRKLAVAEFDGICSAHAMVVRAKPDVVLPEFLPFLMMSDRFMNRAVEISVGSLSPTINWKTLKLEEFALPPLDQQRRIAEILWAVDEAVQCNLKQREATDAAYSIATQSLLFERSHPAIRVADLCEINSSVLSETRTDGHFRFNYIDIGSIVAPKTIGSLKTHEFATAPSRARRRVKEGDILISTVRPNLKAFARLGRLNCEHVASTGFAVISPKTEVLGSLVFHAFFSPQYMAYCDARVTGTSYPAVNAKDVGDFVVCLPKGKVKQEQAKHFLDNLEFASMSLTEHITKGSHLLKQFVEGITTEGYRDV